MKVATNNSNQVRLHVALWPPHPVFIITEEVRGDTSAGSSFMLDETKAYTPEQLRQIVHDNFAAAEKQFKP